MADARPISFGDVLGSTTEANDAQKEEFRIAVGLSAEGNQALSAFAAVLGLVADDNTPEEVKTKLLAVLGLTPADVAGLADALSGKLDASGAAVAAALDGLYGTSWQPRTPSNWVMVVGKVGTTYGYRVNFQGAFVDPLVIAGRTVDAFLAISPNIIRFRIDDDEGEDTPVTGADALNITLRDLTGNAINVTLIWDENSAHYQGISSDAYDWLAARESATITITGLGEPYGLSNLTLTGTIPTAMTVGQSYSEVVTAFEGVAPLTFSLVGTWPTDSAVDAIDGSSAAVSVSPDTPGTFTDLAVRVTDSASPPATADLTVGTITVSAATALSISGTPVTTGTQGAAYAGFELTVVGGVAPFSFSLQGDWPAGPTINASGEFGGATLGKSGTFADLSVRVTDTLGATADLTPFTLTVAALDGLLVWHDERANNPIFGTIVVGDWLITYAVRTGAHGGNPPALTNIDPVLNPWVLWGSFVDGTDRAAAVYKMKATRTDHTAVWDNVSGVRGAQCHRGREPDVLKFATVATGANVTFPGL